MVNMLIYIICNLQNQLKKYDIISYKLKQISKDIKRTSKISAYNRSSLLT